MPASQHTIDNRLHYMKMNGPEVYRFATRVMGKVAKQACERAGVDLDEIDLFIPHQANIRIIKSASKYLGINETKVFTNLHKYGNTSAASIPIALCEAIEEGRIKTNDRLVMVGFGGGLSWGATVVKWGVPMPYKPRQWWYRAFRWTVYRWAELRSRTRRLLRRLEGRWPARHEEDVYPPVKPDKVKEKKPDYAPKVQPPAEHTNGANGSTKPRSTDLPVEIPLTKPIEPEEVTLDPDNHTNGNQDKKISIHKKG